MEAGGFLSVHRLLQTSQLGNNVTLARATESSFSAAPLPPPRAVRGSFIDIISLVLCELVFPLVDVNYDVMGVATTNITAHGLCCAQDFLNSSRMFSS